MFDRLADILAKAARSTAETAREWPCDWIFYQTEVPAELKDEE